MSRTGAISRYGVRRPASARAAGRPDARASAAWLTGRTPSLLADAGLVHDGVDLRLGRLESVLDRRAGVDLLVGGHPLLADGAQLRVRRQGQASVLLEVRLG